MNEPNLQNGDRDVVVIVSMSRGIGGPARALLAALPRLAEFERVLFAPAGGFARLAVARGDVERHVPMAAAGRVRQLSRVRASRQLLRLVRECGDRLVAIHANGETDLNLAAVPALATGTPVVMWAHSSEPSPTAGLLRAFWRRRRRVAWLAVSEVARATLADILRIDPASITIVENPIDPEDVTGQRTTNERPQVGYLGLTTQAKGFDLLPEVVRRVGPTIAGWRLFVSEPHPMAMPEELDAWRQLQELGDSHDVTIAGRTTDLARAYGSCDVVLCPSQSESFGRVAAEAMAAGIPVVASDIPAYRRLVAEPGAGLLFPLGDAAAAAEAVSRLAEDPELRSSMGQRGREAVRRYDPAFIGAQLTRAYREAGGEPG